MVLPFRPQKAIATGDLEHIAFAELDVEAKLLKATDGTIAVMLPVVPESGDSSGPLSAEIFIAAQDAGTDHVIAPHGLAAVSTQGRMFRRGDMSRRLPPFEKAMPKFRAGDVGTVSISINPGLLLRLAETIASESGVTLTIKIPAVGGAMNDPILVTPGEEGEAGGAIGALMPLLSQIKHASRIRPVAAEVTDNGTKSPGGAP